MLKNTQYRFLPVLLVRYVLFILLLPVPSAYAAPSPIKVFVSIPPQAYLLERIGGDIVEVRTLVPPGQGPHTFEPTPKQIAALSDAALYCAVGLPFEARLLEKAKALNPSLCVADTARNVPRRTMAASESDEHDGEHGHGAGTPDPHVWLCPANAKAIAREMAEVLGRFAPSRVVEIAGRLGALEGDLDKLDGRVARELAPFKGSRVYVYHPAFGYFCDAYGLRQVPVEIEGKEPSARQLADLVVRALRDKVRVIFVQRQYPSRVAQALAAETGAAVVAIDPLAYDLVANLDAIAEAVRKALEKP